MPAVISSGNELPQISSEQSSFLIYPNPTTGNFTLELKEGTPDDHVTVEIIGMRGEKVVTKILEGISKQEFSLSEQPVGLYFIRVISGRITGSGKIIKQ